MTRGLRGTLAAVVLGACSPVLSPVVDNRPQALPYEHVAPQVVWVLDSSGSMSTELGVAGLTRRQAVLDALREFSTRGLVARHGLLTFPQAGSANQCAAPGALAVAPPLDALAPSAAMSDVLATASATSAFGGSPLGLTLRFAADAVAVDVRTETYAVVITDGLPNCNADNPHGACFLANPQCVCTLTPASSCAPLSTYCALGCLDDLNTMDAARLLAGRGVLVEVLGLGPDVLTADPNVLATMEVALPPLCANAADCRSGSACQPDGTCAERFYSVPNQTFFAAPMNRLAQALRESERCGVWLAQDLDPTALTVFVDGLEVPPGEWSLTAGRRLRVFGDGCARLQEPGAVLTFSSTPAPTP